VDNRQCTDEPEAVQKTIAELRERCDRMVNLVRFADHRECCATRTCREATCNCGYLDAVAGRSESHDNLCRLAKAGDTEPPKGPMSKAEIEESERCTRPTRLKS